MMNKKGDLDDYLMHFLAIVFIVILVVIGTMYYTSRQVELSTESQEMKKDIEVDLRLKEFTTSTIEYDLDEDGNEDKVRMKDLILFSYLQEDYSLLEKELEDFFNRIRTSQNTDWLFELSLMPEDEELITVRDLGDLDFAGFSGGDSILYLPVSEQDKQIKIRLRCRGNTC